MISVVRDALPTLREGTGLRRTVAGCGAPTRHGYAGAIEALHALRCRMYSMSSPMINTTVAIRRALPFWIFAAFAVVAGGALAAALAHAPTRLVMWLVAYLVLVVGVAQAALAAGQLWLAPMPPSRGLVLGQWLLFNAANGLVAGGTLLAQRAWVNAGTLLLVVALALFLRGVRGATKGWPIRIYRALVWLLGCSALVGVGLTWLRTRP